MYIIPFKGTKKARKSAIYQGGQKDIAMNKKVKKFFKRGRPQPRSNFGVDICNVNIVSEAEKIIEEYVNKMGYRIPKQKSSKKIILAVISSLAAAAVAYTIWRVFLV